jgi:heat shock protein HslJ
MAGAASRDVVHLLQGSGVTADLDADGVDEAVVLLEHDATGSGRFIYLGVVNHNVAIAATRLIGDRVQVMTLNAGTAGVAAQVLRAGEDDAACCPGEKARLTWQYSMADGLSRARETVVGRLSRADLLGSWRLLSFHGAAPSQIFTLVIEPDSIGGRTPCAGYAGTMAMGDGPGAIVLRARAATAAECKDDTARPARRYLEALNDVVQFAFAPGQLVLEGPNGALVFSRATVDQASVR